MKWNYIDNFQKISFSLETYDIWNLGSLPVLYQRENTYDIPEYWILVVTFVIFKKG